MAKDRPPKYRPGTDVAALCRAMQQDRLVLKRVRANVRVMTEQAVGRWWSEFADTGPVLVNLIGKYQSVIGRKLAPKNARCLLSTFDRQVAPALSKLQAAVNDRADELNLSDQLGAAVVNSLYSMGIMKVGLAAPTDSAVGAWGVRAGEVFAESVDPDDYVCDTHATDWSRLQYEGHRVRVTLDSVKELYGRRARDMVADQHRQFNQEGDERLGVLFRGYYSSKEEYRPMVDLWEIFDPEEQKIIVLADSQLTGAYYDRYRSTVEPLWEQKWVGPPWGPLLKLPLSKVPGNLWPSAPIQWIFDLHVTVNNQLNKLAYQADAEKVVYGVPGAAHEDGKRIAEARDRQMVPCDVPPTVIATPGPDQGVFNLTQFFMAEFNKTGGNLDLLMGSGPESDTLGQDRMLNANAGAVLGEMEDRVLDFTSDVFRSLVWFLQHHPTATYKSDYTKHKGVRLVRTSTPRERAEKLRYGEYKIRVDPYSLKHRSPEERLAAIERRVMNYVVPMSPVWAQNGGPDFDWYGLNKLIAEYTDEPKWAELFGMTTQPPPPDQQGGASGLPHTATKAPQTTREVLRRTAGGGGAQPQPVQMPVLSANGQAGPTPLTSIGR